MLLFMAVAGQMMTGAEAFSAEPVFTEQGEQVRSDEISPAKTSPDADEALKEADRLLHTADEQPMSDKMGEEQANAEKTKLEGQVKEATEREKLAAEKGALGNSHAVQKTAETNDNIKKKNVTAGKEKKVSHRTRKKKNHRKAYIPGLSPVMEDFHKDDGIHKKSTARKKPVRKHTSGARKKAGNRAHASVSRVPLAEIRKILSTTRNFDGMNLSGVNLTGFDLTGASLRGANLTNSNLERANLQEANLERANLKSANLYMSSLRLANINAANLDGANLDRAIWTEGRICLEGSRGFCKDVIP
ncbi:pentapeptide repeat protein [Geotalea uraniireducens Rf4]|uniref:Pentapeptide repeat protein n=2 Tax=Geotalea uraniireducens TaxID=351604 RepID=A5GEH4_GEOUR|nr:pentapeptide repeat protein [Geotalea uraniireducens Rf4]